MNNINNVLDDMAQRQYTVLSALMYEQEDVFDGYCVTDAQTYKVTYTEKAPTVTQSNWKQKVLVIIRGDRYTTHPWATHFYLKRDDVYRNLNNCSIKVPSGQSMSS
jgi:hypothetical protein